MIEKLVKSLILATVSLVPVLLLWIWTAWAAGPQLDFKWVFAWMLFTILIDINRKIDED